jgi:hypothetical protein
LGQRSRKRGRHERPAAAEAELAAARPSRAIRMEQQNAAIRATLQPYARGERPWVIKISTLAAAALGGVQLVLYLAHVKLTVAGSQPKAGSTIIFAVLMFACALGVWLMRYWAVLGFMALLALVTMYFFLALIKVSSVLGLAIALAGAGICGALFYKLVRVLSRIQMPRYQPRSERGSG